VWGLGSKSENVDLPKVEESLRLQSVGMHIKVVLGLGTTVCVSLSFSFAFFVE
jgi:hypothetical protein